MRSYDSRVSQMTRVSFITNRAVDWTQRPSDIWFESPSPFKRKSRGFISNTSINSPTGVCVLSIDEMLRWHMNEVVGKRRKSLCRIVCVTASFRARECSVSLLSLNQRGGKLNVEPSFISSPGTAGCEAACLNIYTQMQRRAHRNWSARCQPSINRKKNFQFLTRSTFSTPSHCGTLADQQFLFFLFALHVSVYFVCEATHLRDTLGLYLTVKTLPTHCLSFCFNN